LGDKIEAGPLSHIAATSMERRVLMLPREDKLFLVGWPADAVDGSLMEKSKKIVASWDS
jgi:hypothetical protein